MNRKAELPPKPLGNEFVGARLKRLRRERHLVQRAIIALTELSLSQRLRDRRATRNW